MARRDENGSARSPIVETRAQTRALTRAQVLRGGLSLAALSVAGKAMATSKYSDTWEFLDGEGFPYDAFDRLPQTDIHMLGGVVHVGFAPGEFALPKSAILDRVRGAAFAVAHYYGHYPVPSVRYLIVPIDGEGVRGGTTWGYRGAACRILIGRDCDVDELKLDWIMTHEMVHTALPDMPERYNWLSEGLAVYVEPVARVQVGEMSARSIWSDMKRDMPKGLPRAGDEGLDYTATWGRIYWGGALYCLLCDIGIRQKSNNRIGLQEAMRGVLAAGGNHDVEWPIGRILETADRTTGFSIMSDLYARMRAKPVRPDMDKLWADLGVAGEPGEIVLNDDAPLAPIRAAITHPPSA